MEYEIHTTELYDSWVASLRDAVTRRKIAARLVRVSTGNFGDYKALGNRLFELRLFFGAGIRIYYTIRDGKIVLLLAGGDKSSQEKDISKARILLDALE